MRPKQCFMKATHTMKSLITLAVAATVSLAATSAMAGPIYTFSISEGTQPANVGTITLTQVDLDSVQIGVDLLPGYGFVNTGGQHTPFAFNLTGSGALSISPFTTPAGGIYNLTSVFSLNAGGGDNTPYGTFGIALDSNADNGSGNGYFGDLLFTLNRVGGLDTNDFVRNADNDPIVGGSYFSADLSDGRNTGAQAWSQRTEGPIPPTAIPLPSTLSLFGIALAGLGLTRRKRA
jgi:PEP-CTERM motif